MYMKSEPKQPQLNLNLYKVKFMKHKYTFIITNRENSIVNNVKKNM